MAQFNITEELALYAAKSSINGNINEITKTLISNYYKAKNIIDDFKKQEKQVAKAAKLAKKQAVKEEKEIIKQDAKKRKSAKKQAKKAAAVEDNKTKKHAKKLNKNKKIITDLEEFGFTAH